MKYTDEQRIARIKETTSKLLSYIRDAGISEEDVLEKEPVRWTITTPLYNIGEHSYYLSDEFKKAHDNIPWAKISGLRHRLVHDYEDTNWSIICNIIFDILPGFLEDINKLESN